MAERKGKLPGEELVSKGLQDLAQGVTSIESLLVLIGAPRLQRLGLAVPERIRLRGSPEHALYQLLQAEDPRDAHSRYNAFLRRLVSYERMLESSQ